MLIKENIVVDPKRDGSNKHSTCDVNDVTRGTNCHHSVTGASHLHCTAILVEEAIVTQLTTRLLNSALSRSMRWHWLLMWCCVLSLSTRLLNASISIEISAIYRSKHWIEVERARDCGFNECEALITNRVNVAHTHSKLPFVGASSIPVMC